MATQIIIKKSTTSGAAPLIADIDQGEFAVNLADRKLYTKDNGGAIVRIDGAYVDSVAPSNPAEGDLWYDTTNNILMTHNGSAFVAAGYSTLSALEDVAITSLATDDILIYDGSDWVNKTLAESGALMDSELTDLAAVKAINQGLTTTSDVTFNDVNITADLLVGTTSTALQTSTTDNGLTYFDGSFLTVARNGGAVAYFNRHGDTGKLLVFRQDGANAGAIETIDRGSSVYDVSLSLSGDNDQYIQGLGGSDSIQFGTAGATRMTLNSAGNLTLTGTVDGRDVAADGTKLDTIETNADVTDTANVTAAGALMDSEITNLAAVKAFDPADYASANETLSTVTGRGATTSTAISITNATASTTTTNGALTVSGGAGIGGNINVGGNAVITGNLTVQGTTTSVNSNIVEIGDSVILLNNDETGSPSENAGFEVERGTASNVQFVWNETTDAWDMDGEALQNVVIDGGTY